MNEFPPIEKLIPHRGRMVFLSKVLSCDGRSLIASCIPREHHSRQVGIGEIDACCGIEYIGQAAAAFLQLSGSAHDNPRPGYLVSIRKAVFMVDQFSIGDELSVEVALEDLSGQFALFSGKIRERSGKDLLLGRFGVYCPVESLGILTP